MFPGVLLKIFVAGPEFVELSAVFLDAVHVILFLPQEFVTRMCLADTRYYIIGVKENDPEKKNKQGKNIPVLHPCRHFLDYVFITEPVPEIGLQIFTT
jgi:hypothetical protein